MDAARFQSEQLQSPTAAYGDDSLARHIAVFTKGLPHDQYGEVDRAAYQTLLDAIASGQHADFERIARGSGRRLVSPQAAYAFQLEGGDSHRFACSPPPAFASAEAATDMNELYWHALCRDIPFAEYAESEQIRYAADNLKTTPRSIFRGPGQGEIDGPYLSQ